MAYDAEIAKPVNIPFSLDDFDWITSSAKRRGISRAGFIRQEILRLKAETERVDAQSS